MTGSNMIFQAIQAAVMSASNLALQAASDLDISANYETLSHKFVKVEGQEAYTYSAILQDSGDNVIASIGPIVLDASEQWRDKFNAPYINSCFMVAYIEAAKPGSIEPKPYTGPITLAR